MKKMIEVAVSPQTAERIRNHALNDGTIFKVVNDEGLIRTNLFENIVDMVRDYWLADHEENPNSDEFNTALNELMDFWEEEAEHNF